MKTVADYLCETGGRMNGSDMKGLPTAIELGLTVRDYFAAQALRGFIKFFTQKDGTLNFGFVADSAYALADAMLAERKRVLNYDPVEQAEPGNG